MPGCRLSLAEREEIRVGLAKEESFSRIAARLGRAASTVSREVGRNRSRRGYVAHVAQRRATPRPRRPRRLRLETDIELRRAVGKRLKLRLSPETIARQLAAEGTPISAETIYRACYHPRLLLGADAYRRLCRPRRGRIRRRRTATGRKPLSLGVFKPISERPGDPGTEPGHWEGDLLVGRRNLTAVVVLTERSTRYTLLGALPQGCNADHVGDVVTRLLSQVPPQLRQTLTWDQGRELARWQRIEDHLETTPVFFCEPRSPWQKPLVENTNGLLRRWLPRGIPIPRSQAAMNQLTQLVNSIHRRVLGWETATAAYDQLRVATAS